MPTCKACGQTILWAKTKDGKNTPLQKVQAFEVDWTRNEYGVAYEREYQAHALKIERDIYVSHFMLCPGATVKAKPTKGNV